MLQLFHAHSLGIDDNLVKMKLIAEMNIASMAIDKEYVLEQ
jgi:hypothetical protein